MKCSFYLFGSTFCSLSVCTNLIIFGEITENGRNQSFVLGLCFFPFREDAKRCRMRDIEREKIVFMKIQLTFLMSLSDFALAIQWINYF